MSLATESVTDSSVTRQLLPVAGPGETWRLLWGELRSHRAALVATLVVSVLAASAALVAPWMLGVLVDEVDRAGTGADVWTVVGVLVVSAVAAAVLTGWSAVLLARLGNTVLARLRERVLEKTLRLPTATAERVGSGDLLSRVGDDVSVVSEAVITTGPQVVSSLLTVVLTGAGLFALDWRLGVAGLLAVPGYALSLRWYLPKAAPFYAREREAMAERSHVLVGSLHGVETVRSYRWESTHEELIARRSAAAMDLTVGVFKFFTRFASRNNRAECIGLLAVLVVGFLLVDADAVTVGAVTAAALYFHRLFNPLGALVTVFDDIQSAGASLARLAGVASLPDPVEPADPPAPADTGLTLTGVAHRYDGGPEVLSDVSLSVAPGEHVALVGTSGAGKTTLAGVAAGVIEPVAGSVRLGGVELSTLGDAVVRGRITLLSQEVHVFTGSLADDLRLAAPDADDARLTAALATVSADGWVRALPDGLDTKVGEHAHPLTAAQSQQLALARVVLADPDVVILDEATAEAGSAGARRLEEAAAAATEGRTTIIVAHRLTQAQQADRVVVMEHGRIVEQGSHTALLAAGGRYRQLWDSWTGLTDAGATGGR
ncbi:ATP-binding cassette subfamily C protein [Stackebrandtia albiflava]|uniref:ATP-binding cassette subfamily C protein n=1 Tax=Stackebrandtia albiflava TaxID=406432 RepID=A0A562VBV7_9ACTN|nr:ABC transporter ATP-binding protein [Stackebrandtia albiflava]TWJ15359.1 ATP-binding cassette subfamily C protein [Stackebrandtia albiflava]